MRLPAHLYVALDTPDVCRAAGLTKDLAGVVDGFKLGLEFFSHNGPKGVERVFKDIPRFRDDEGRGGKLFLDLKLHDIPNTVAGAVRAALPLEPDLLTLHAAGGAAMMQAAREAAAEATRPLSLLAVTVLTSLDDLDLAKIGQVGPTSEQSMRLTILARECGMDGAVCSPHEISTLRRECGDEFQLVVPGIRPAGAETSDQKRTATPHAAVWDGADSLVVGRPITEAKDPRKAALEIDHEMMAGASCVQP